MLDSAKKQYKIRLAGIDAPEKRQAFGDRAKEMMSDLVFKRPVLVEWGKLDRYGRTVGKVLVAPPDARCQGRELP